MLPAGKEEGKYLTIGDHPERENKADINMMSTNPSLLCTSSKSLKSLFSRILSYVNVVLYVICIRL